MNKEQQNEEQQSKLVVFQEKGIRRIWHEEEWYFAVVDIIEVLTESTKPRDYWYRLKKREKESSGVELSTICRQLKIESTDGKKYNTECANTKVCFVLFNLSPPLKPNLLNNG